MFGWCVRAQSLGLPAWPRTEARTIRTGGEIIQLVEELEAFKFCPFEDKWRNLLSEIEQPPFALPAGHPYIDVRVVV
jgi:hypothetical protein